MFSIRRKDKRILSVVLPVMLVSGLLQIQVLGAQPIIANGDRARYMAVSGQTDRNSAGASAENTGFHSGEDASGSIAGPGAHYMEETVARTAAADAAELMAAGGAVGEETSASGDWTMASENGTLADQAGEIDADQGSAESSDAEKSSAEVTDAEVESEESGVSGDMTADPNEAVPADIAENSGTNKDNVENSDVNKDNVENSGTNKDNVENSDVNNDIEEGGNAENGEAESSACDEADVITSDDFAADTREDAVANDQEAGLEETAGEEGTAGAEEYAAEEEAGGNGESAADTDLPPAIADETGVTADSDPESVSGTAAASGETGLSVEYRTQDEIRDFYRNNPAPFLANTYEETPSAVAPYNAGKLSAETQTYGLNALNQARFIAGLPADVTVNDSYVEKVQAGALVNAANNQLSHFPSQPADMDDDLYNLGLSGTSSANIAWSQESIAYSVHLWMGDSDSSNIDVVGHRRWILNPSMLQTGFGAVGRYSAMYAFDFNRSSSYKGVAWPAQNMPLEYFNDDDAWSISFGTSVNKDNISISLKRSSDEKEWNFSSSSADGYFNVNNDGYGQTGCVIFRPDDISYNSGDHFDVTITGVGDSTVKYSVEFFSICEGNHDYSEEVIKEPTCTENGKIRKICVNCGHVDYEYPEAFGHSYHQISAGDGLATISCSTCGNEVTGAVPSSFTPFWKDLADTESSYYYALIPSGLEAGAQIAVWMPASYIKYEAEADNYFNDFAVEVQETDGCEVVQTSNDQAKLTFGDVGTYHINIYPIYNPDIVQTYTIKIVKQLEGAALSIDGSSPLPYGSTIRLTGIPDGGKGTLRYTFTQIAEDGAEQILVSDSESPVCQWKPSAAGTYRLRVSVSDSGDENRTVTSEDAEFTISKDDTIIRDGKTITAVNALTYGQAVSEAGVTNADFIGNTTGESLAGAFTFDDPDEILPAGTHSVGWTFTPDDSNYEQTSGTIDVTVEKALPVIQNAPAAEAVYHPGGKLSSIPLTGGETNTEGSWEWVSGDLIPAVPGGTYACRFVPADGDNYESAETMAELTLKKAVPYLREISPASIVYGQKLEDSALGGAAQYSREDSTEVSGTFRWADDTVSPSVSDSEKTEYEVIFTPDDTDNYGLVSGQTKITVEKAEHPAEMPPEMIGVPFTTESISDDILANRGIGSWKFAEKEQGRELQVGEPLAVKAVYDGADAGNYKTEEVTISVTRSSCEHDGEKRIEGAKLPNCEEEGATGDTYCAICGELLESSVVIPAKGHSWNNGIVTTAPTLESEGVRTFTCDVCGEEKTESIPKLIDLSYAEIQGLQDMTFTGSALSQNLEVKLGEILLSEGTDYAVSYTDNINAGTATVTVEGQGLYGGTASAAFAIGAKSISGADVIGLKSKTYTGKALTQSMTVMDGDVTLQENTDYTVSYENNVNAGKAIITITGKGNYSGTRKKSFTIGRAVQSISVKASASAIAVGKTAVVSVSGNKGKKTFKSSNTAVATVNSAGKVTAKKVGKVTITVTSAQTTNYKAASKKITINVVPAATSSITAANQATGIKLTWKRVTGATGYLVYRGSVKAATITKGTTVTFVDKKANTNGAKYTYKVIPTASTGKGTAKSIVTYKVARPSISSAKNTASRKMVVKWGKNARATNYQIQYSTSKAFASGTKTTTVTSATVSKVFTNLKKGRTYYVRMRTLKTVGNGKYWSVWSAVKSVKITK